MEKRGMMKRFLAESLKELMLQKSFEKITIKQICDKTGVIRATFYNYFEDKYAALSYIIYLDTVETALPYIEKRQFLQAVKAMLDNFVENREFYQIAFRITGQNSFEDLFEENVQQLFTEMFRRYGRPEKLGTMSEEELAADAAAFAQAAMQEDAEAASDDAGDGNAVNADGNTDADK